jgi:hypothetical protein
MLFHEGAGPLPGIGGEQMLHVMAHMACILEKEHK